MSRKERTEAFVRSAFPDQTFEEAKKDFREFYTGENDRLQAAEKAYRNLVVLLLKNQSFPEPKVSSRLKDWNECIKKFDGKYRGPLEATGQPYVIKDHISDLIGLRVVCIYESDIEEVSKLLHTHFDVIGETNKSKQMENIESGFGYKGLHLDLRLNSKRKTLPEYADFGSLQFEIQIRTIVQDAWSEVDHKLKYKKQTPINLRRRIHRLAALFELADQEFEAIRDLSAKLEDEALASNTKLDEENTALDLFGFLRVSTQYFPRFVFSGEPLDGLLSDIERADDRISVSDFRTAMEDGIKKVFEYFDYLVTQGHSQTSPYTMIRHALYYKNRVVFENMIFDNHRKNFDRWLEYGTVHPREVEMIKQAN